MIKIFGHELAIGNQLYKVQAELVSPGLNSIS